MDFLAVMGNHYYGLFQAGGEFLLTYLKNFLVWMILLITFMNILKNVIGRKRIEKLVKIFGKYGLTRWTLMPMVVIIFMGKNELYQQGRLLEENQKAAYFDAASSFSHPVTGLFPHANPRELFVFMGIAAGVYLAGYDLGFLGIAYFLTGLIVVLIRGCITQLIVNLKLKNKSLKEETDVSGSTD